MEFHCPQCEASLSLSDDAAGKRAQCPRCNHLFTVPTLGAPMSPFQDQVTHATIRPGRNDVVTCPGCDRLLAFDEMTAGHVVICPSCQRRLRLPTVEQVRTSQPSAVQPSSTWASCEEPSVSSARDWSTASSPTTTYSSGPSPVNPYSPVDSTSMGLRRGSADFTAPGVALCVTSGVGFIIALLVFVFGCIDLIANGLRLEGSIFLVWVGFSLLLNGVSFVGGWNLARQQSLQWARWGSIAALFSPFGSYCCVLQFPFAIWATVIAFSESATHVFARVPSRK